MVQANAYTTLVGAPPDVNTLAFLRWKDDYTFQRKSPCMFRRTTRYYIDPVGGNDGNAGTTPALAWASMTPVRTRIAAGDDNVAFLFKRGTQILDHAGTLINNGNNGLYFGSYGPAQAAKPIISNFTIRLAAASITWTDAGSGRWTATIPGSGVNNPSGATAWGWIREQANPFNPYTYVDSTGKVESTTYSFFVSGTTIHLNPGTGIDPNTVSYEAVPYPGSVGAMVHGLAIRSGCTNTWINGLRFDGWGCVPVSNGGSYGIKFEGIDDEVAYISDCEEYYGGRHALSIEGNSSGGYSVWERCTQGYLVSISGCTFFNQYQPSGLSEAVFKDCCVRFGQLPSDVTGASSNWVKGDALVGAAFYGHTSSDSFQNALLIVDGFVSLDERGKWDRATTCKDRFYVFPRQYPGNEYDPSTCRVFVINWRPNKATATLADNSGTSRVVYPSFLEKAIYINSHFYLARKATTTSTQFVSTSVDNRNGFGALFINTILEFDDGEGDSNGELLVMSALSVATSGNSGVTYPSGQPIRVTTTNAHRLATGDRIFLSNVGTTGGETNPNGEWVVTVISSTVVDLQGTVGNGGAASGSGNMVPRNAPRLLNSLILVRGMRQDRTNSAHQLSINNRFGQPFLRLANTVIAAPSRLHDLPNDLLADTAQDLRIAASRRTNVSTNPGCKNAPASLAYVAIMGCLVADTGATANDYEGFSAATGLVDLHTAVDLPPVGDTGGADAGYQGLDPIWGNSLPPTSPLAEAGSVDPFPSDSALPAAPEYDFYGRVRPLVPSIGPFDVMVASRADLVADDGGSGDAQALLRSPLRSSLTS
jgi:hypothetical protein